MNHPASRWSAVALFLFVLLTAGWLVVGRPSQTALAHFAEPLIKAKTAKFKLTARANGKVVAVSHLLVSGARMRNDVQQPDGGRRQIDVRDEESDRSLTLLPTEKKAEVIRYTNRPAAMKSGGFLAETQKMLLESETDGKTTRESLGEREIDGRKLVGYRIASPAMTLELWGDPATGLPHSITQTMAAYPSMTTTMSDFEFDMPFDEALLSLEPPAGYEVSQREVDLAPPTEADLIAALRTAAELGDGVFPDALNMEIGHGMVKAFHAANAENLPAAELEKKSQELTMGFVRGFGFTLQFPPDSQHYAGKDVKLNTPNIPIYWYQPEGKTTYRVIYADLSTADMDRAPNAE